MAQSRRAEDPEDSNQHQNRDSHWRVLKEISIPTLVLLIGQMVAGIWWAASITAEVRALEKTLAQNQTAQATVDVKQDTESMRAEARILAQLERLNIKLDRIIEVYRK